MNKGRTIVGGIIAGLLLTAGDFIIHQVILGKRYLAIVHAGHMRMAQGGKEHAVHLVISIATGLVIAFMYSGFRPRLGPGPKTAMVVGFFAWILIYAAWAGNMYLYGMNGRFVPFVMTVGGFVATQIAALVAGALYKEAGGAMSPAPVAK